MDMLKLFDDLFMSPRNKKQWKKYEAFYIRGNGLVEAGQYEAAIASYDQALQFKPDCHKTWCHRGFALANLGCYEEAIASYEQALRIKPNEDEAWYNQACSYALQAVGELALQSLQKAIMLNPSHREQAKTDVDFGRLKADPSFRALVYSA